MTIPFDTEKPYACMKDAEWWCVFGAGRFAFRFGPFKGEEVGDVLHRCVLEQIPVTVVANCGPEIDWEIARDMRGDLSKMNFIQRWRFNRRARRLQEQFGDREKTRAKPDAA